VTLAHSEEEVREAQRLRYKVFVEELGARVQTRLPNHDIDLL
jgi:putative hemolysin